MPDQDGIYSAPASLSDYDYLDKSMLKGSFWEIYEWGEYRGTFEVDERIEGKGGKRLMLYNKFTKKRSCVFLSVLVAKPANVS